MSIQKEEIKNNNYVCEFCSKSFTTLYNLKNHQKTAKYCLDIQNKHADTTYNCEFCNKSFNVKSIYNSHISSCKEKKSQEEKEQNNLLLKRIKELEKEISQKDKTNSDLRVKLSTKDETIKILEKTNTKLEKTISKLIEHSTVINNNIDNRKQTEYNIQ